MESFVDLRDGARLRVSVDDFTDPWRSHETVLLVHGLAESADAWFGWIPILARKLRVVRVDLRGFGYSTPMRRDFPWSLDILAEDLSRVIEEVAREPVHVVGAKIGATVSVRFAAKYPDLLKSVTLIGLPLRGSRQRPGLDLETHSVREWARSSMEERLGNEVPEPMLEWWADLMGRTPRSTLLGFSDSAGDFDVSDDISQLRLPVLAITSDSVRHPVSKTESWRQQLEESEIFVIPGDGYHAAAVYPDLCAAAVLDFIERSGRRGAPQSKR